MRPLFAYLRAVVVPTGVFAATEDFGSHGLSDRITRAAAELAALVLSQGGYGVGGFAPDLSARPRRTSGTQVEADVTPFGDLLRGHSGTD
jgi:FMN reductase